MIKREGMAFRSIGVEAINGSFYNVMGLPVQKLYQELKHF